PSRYFSDTTFLNSNENFSMHPQFLVWCLTFGAQFKNDGHYFCRAGGNRPDGLNEPVTLFLPHTSHLSTTDEKWFFRNLGGRKWMKLSGEQGSKLF
ncbi:hypothetical protein ODR16_25715, partial [Escherichia coli]|nr:hypothetical protein [Escherichia coli]MCV8156777.1 hypothetical protein [Escherichia coli]